MVRHMRFGLRNLAVAGALMTSVPALSTASAQSPAISLPSPEHTNPPITLPSGVIVRQGEHVIFRGRNGGNLTITIEKPTPAADSTRVAHVAREVAEFYSDFARTLGIDGIIVSVCQTQACLELRDNPTERFQFTRAKDGSWSPARP